jgi:hypothetical protein
MLKQQTMRIHLIIFSFFVFGISSCKKDKLVPETTASIQNDLIIGGGVTSFQRIIGGQKLDGLYSVKQTTDGGYIFCGFTENDGTSERDVFLIRTDTAGETLWIKKFSGTYTDQAWYVEITADNGFILAATSNLGPSSSMHNYNGQLIKTDSNGNLIWKQSFNFGNYTNFTTVKETGDGGYIVCGTEYFSNKGIALKTDALGIESWRKTYGGIVEINNIDKTSDGGFVMCGSIKANSSSRSDIYIIRTNSVGDTLWTETFGDASDNTARAIKETPSGDFILCGYNTNPGASGYAKLIDANGGQIWHTDFLNSDVQALDNIATTSDNQFITVGRNSFGPDNKALLQKIDSNGNSTWIKWFNPRNVNLFNEVQQTTDNGFIIAGYTFGDGYIVKTDGNGN